MSPVRVVVAEDQHLVRAGLVTMLRVSDGFEVVGEVADGEAAVAAVRRTQPDVALLDLRMPVLDGIAATRRIVAEVPRTRVLALTTFGSDEFLFGALEAGASGFLLKDVAPEALLEAVAAVARGEGRLDPAVTGAVVRHFAAEPPREGDDRTEPVTPLTPREEQVLRLVARGSEQRRGRRGARGRRDHGEDPRRGAAGQAGGARPGAGGDLRLRDRSHRPLTAPAGKSPSLRLVGPT